MHSSASLESGLAESEKRVKRARHRSGSSWDLLGERAEWEEYNVAQASVENLRFAEGDVGTNKVRNRVPAEQGNSVDTGGNIAQQVLLLGVKPWDRSPVDLVHHSCDGPALDSGCRRSYRSTSCGYMGRQAGILRLSPCWRIADEASALVVRLAVGTVGRILGVDRRMDDSPRYLAEYYRKYHPECEEVYRRHPSSWPVGPSVPPSLKRRLMCK